MTNAKVIVSVLVLAGTLLVSAAATAAVYASHAMPEVVVGVKAMVKAL